MKKILCVALALMLVLSLAACSMITDLLGGKSRNVGKYYFQSMEMEGMSINREALMSMGGMTEEELDEYMLIEITGEGKATMTSDGEVAEMAFDATHMWPIDDPEEKAAYTLKDGTLTITEDGLSLIFAKK